MKQAARHNDIITYVFNAGTAAPLITTVVVTSSNLLQIDHLKVAIHDDLTNATAPLSVTYQTPAASIPGSGYIYVNSWPDIAQETFKDSAGIVITDGTQVGTATLSVVVPAGTPGSPIVPDPNKTYPCTFSITPSQEKLWSD